MEYASPREQYVLNTPGISRANAETTGAMFSSRDNYRVLRLQYELRYLHYLRRLRKSHLRNNEALRGTGYFERAKRNERNDKAIVVSRTNINVICYSLKNNLPKI